MLNWVAHSGLAQQAVHELQVKRLVDEAGALAIQLVAQAAGAKHRHGLAAVPGADGLAHGLAHGVDALALGSGNCTVLMQMGTTVTGPVALGPEQLERQRAGVVDQHFLAGDDVKLLVDQRVDDVPGQVQVRL
jgi:hypothetical protein